MSRTLVYGIGLAGRAVAEALRARGVEVVLGDDTPSDAAGEWARSMGWEIGRGVDTLDGVDRVCPAPGVPETHPLIVEAARRGVEVTTEIDLAYDWEQQRPGGPRPILAVTGTDGKTTTTELAAHLLRAAGHRAEAVGNTEVPFVARLDGDADVFVVECSSFRLHWAQRFRAEASVWLNFAPDHLNWHTSLDSYRRAKARMWGAVRPSDVAVGYVDDPVVMAELAALGCERRTFGMGAPADYRVEDGELVGPHGTIAAVRDLVRRLPHDITNSLAAAAITLESGLADREAVARGLATFRHPPHRIEAVGERDGIAWFNDSKATTPHAALSAIRAFDHLVLIAGGRNKDLDLTPLASEPQRMRAVVAIGDAADEVRAVFDGVCPVVVVRDSMATAVREARSLARAGDVVLLSPACASFDWYAGGYPARGADFRQLVTTIVLEDAQ